ncbi:hypothetical protein RDI58_003904 [Solanum bulbocastanum]
MYISQK